MRGFGIFGEGGILYRALYEEDGNAVVVAFGLQRRPGYQILEKVELLEANVRRDLDSRWTGAGLGLSSCTLVCAEPSGRLRPKSDSELGRQMGTQRTPARAMDHPQALASHS